MFLFVQRLNPAEIRLQADGFNSLCHLPALGFCENASAMYICLLYYKRTEDRYRGSFGVGSHKCHRGAVLFSVTFFAGCPEIFMVKQKGRAPFGALLVFSGIFGRAASAISALFWRRTGCIQSRLCRWTVHIPLPSCLPYR